ncbi:hypothetical protein PUNSTDRAFT_112772 [Punctularia strigosozonata HHB-11173 SS5]|uniref:uncharacterized protein n=1 Tax=Punctularia strigosozonata (strain HHB-11173) TaxID=741275 RepID=UPI00044179D4|nr:uncharacterized protein PUNSTDRAFT_112772 [Punctularia strigosozonata HHB-11173 SS5]EIN10989.1 hypothetical protein PUNSTDRAFT_112772 [Punctularia strigosozonata HHB-11173 SS5]
MSFQKFLVQLAQAVQSENGPNLAFLLRPTSPHGRDIVKELRNPTYQSMSYYKGSLEEPWDEIAIRYALVVAQVAKDRPAEAYKEEKLLVDNFYGYLQRHSGWTLPALFAILRDLRDLAFDTSQQTECMEDAARVISKAFGLCMTDRISPYGESRKWGVYYIVGLVFKSYFRVKRISLSKNILRALENNAEIPALSEYPKAHQVTFRYYVGMLSFLNEDYAKAEQELTMAFYNCHIHAPRNHERILTYLIPLRILRGHLPTHELLQRFSSLNEMFSPFIAAIRLGDLRSFDVALERWELRLVELNLHLMLEKARELCMRSLFRRVWVISQKSTRMPIALFHLALRSCDLDVPVEEAECYVANMIYKGFMRGYVSHEKQMVVLAATNAFPRLADRQSPFAVV